MADQLQLRGGTTTEHNTFTGASKEVTIDTTKKTAVVHDGATAGGNPLMREDGANSALSLGSASNPSLKFAGDSNTGLYSPGADQLALSTNGTGRLFVDASGNVGVGTAAPQVPLHVRGADTGTDSSLLRLQTPGASNLYFRYKDGSDDNSNWELYTGGSEDLIFSPGANERLRITSDGKLGIGTTSPRSLLHLSSDTGSSTITPTELTIATTTNASDFNVTDPWGKISFYSGDFSSSGPKIHCSINAIASVANGGRSDLVFNTADGSNPEEERVRINSDGNVGIGTTSPNASAKLAVSNGGAETFEFQTGVTSNKNTLLSFNRSTSAWVEQNYGASEHTFNISGSSNEKMRLDSSGRLLVGTSTSPSIGNGQYSLISSIGNSFSATSNGQINIGRGALASSALAGGIALGVVNFTDSAGAIHSQILGATDATTGVNDYPGRLVFSTTRDGESSPTEAMRIDSAQNILFPENATTNKGLFWQSGGFATNVYALYQVSDGIMWRSFDTTKKLIGRVGTTGGVQLTNGATSWSSYVSESRLKDIVGDCDYDQAWSLVRDIELKRYFYKDQDDEFKAGVSYLGPMADWLEAQDPELVIYQEPDEDGPVRTFNQGLLNMKALAALSAALKRIETLEASNTDLLARVSALESA